MTNTFSDVTTYPYENVGPRDIVQHFSALDSIKAYCDILSEFDRVVECLFNRRRTPATRGRLVSGANICEDKLVNTCSQC